MTFSGLFKVTIIERQITQKWYNTELYLQWPTTRKSYIIEQRHFQWPWTTPMSSLKVTPFFDAEYLRNGTRYRHSCNEILIGTYTRPTQQCHFEWSWVILNDLAEYSMTRSVARSLCDSWDSCYLRQGGYVIRTVRQSLPAGLREAQPCQYCFYSVVQKWVFRPTGATHCPAKREIWHESANIWSAPRAKFHVFGSRNVGIQPQNCQNLEFWP